jgi:hypothetical protein
MGGGRIKCGQRAGVNSTGQIWPFLVKRA